MRASRNSRALHGTFRGILGGSKGVNLGGFQEPFKGLPIGIVGISLGLRDFRGVSIVLRAVQGSFKGFQKRFRGSHAPLKGRYKWFQGRFNALQRISQGVPGTF